MSVHGRDLLRVSAPAEADAAYESGGERGDRSGFPLAAAAMPGRQEAGLVLAVIGSKGSPGASECAWSLAALADRRWPTLLVECDLLGGALALRVAGDPATGSLLGVANAAGSMSVDEIAELLPRWL